MASFTDVVFSTILDEDYGKLTEYMEKNINHFSNREWLYFLDMIEIEDIVTNEFKDFCIKILPIATKLSKTESARSGAKSKKFIKLVGDKFTIN